jgi:hypothetical protein
MKDHFVLFLTLVVGKGAWIPSFARFLVFAGIATFCEIT